MSLVSLVSWCKVGCTKINMIMSDVIESRPLVWKLTLEVADPFPGVLSNRNGSGMKYIFFQK